MSEWSKNAKWLKYRYIVFGAVIILLGIFIPVWAQAYWLHVTIIAIYYAILASSWTLLAGFTGQFSFAHMAFAGIGAYTSALITLHTPTPPYMGIIVGTIVAALIGMGIGALILRVRGPYLALFTIAFSEILRIVIGAEYKVTRGNFGLSVPPLFVSTSKLPYYYTILGLLVISLLIMGAILNSRFGLFFRAIREDEDAASAMGVNVTRYKIMAFTISSIFAGLAGAFYGHYVQMLTPNIMLLSQMGLVIAMSIIGGIESLVGAVIGAFLVEFILEYLRDYGEWRLVLFGLALVLILRLSQNGLIYPLYQRLAGKRIEVKTEPQFELELEESKDLKTCSGGGGKNAGSQ
ncbi:MAG: branched-chain amino acid ABC transporter permease [Candidatus Bathyarchaeia archaeon]